MEKLRTAFVFRFAIQKCKDWDIQKHNFACCYVWAWNLVVHTGEGI